MEVDDGKNGAEGSGEQEHHETRDSPNNSTHEKEHGRENSIQDKHPDHDNQQSNLEVQGVTAEELRGSAATNFCLKTDAPHFNLYTGNGDLHLSQLASNLCGVDCHVNETPNLKSSHVNPSGHESEQVTDDIGSILESLVSVTKLPTKRSKRRGDSIDEQISDRAE
jgi:hypothetical protein